MLENKDPDKDSEIGRLLSALFSEHYNSLVDLACCLGHSQDLAEDVVQETFVTVLCDPVKLLTSENKLSCLTDVLEDRVDCARRRASDALRLQRQLEQYHSEVCMDELKLTTLYGGNIDKEDLELLVFVYDEGRDNEELAEELGICPELCRTRVRLAEEKLRSFLTESGFV